MFNIKLIRENLEDVKANLERRKTPEYLELVDEVKQKDEAKKICQNQMVQQELSGHHVLF